MGIPVDAGSKNTPYDFLFIQKLFQNLVGLKYFIKDLENKHVFIV
jgi:hypothetical protein